MVYSLAKIQTVYSLITKHRSGVHITSGDHMQICTQLMNEFNHYFNHFDQNYCFFF
jgi:hypothetical protein